MKKFLFLLSLAGLSASVFAQTALAPLNVQIDTGVGYYGTDITGVYTNGQGGSSKYNSTTGGQPDKYSPSLDAYAKAVYSLKLDSDNTLKFGAGIDNWYGFYTGNANTAQEANQNAGVVNPYLEWQGYGFDLTLGLPIAYFSPNDNGGAANELGYAYFIYKGGFVNSTGATTPSSSSAWVTTYSKATYKYSFAKDLSLTAGVEGDYILTPTAWPLDLKPQVSVVWGAAQLDAKYSLFNYYVDGTSAKQYYSTYLEPKLTFDLGALLPAVAGLKAYVSSRASLTTTNPAYTVAGKTAPFHDTFILPALVYALPVAGVGTFTFEGGYKFNKVDNNYDTSTNFKDVSPYSELQLKAGYTVKF